MRQNISNNEIAELLRAVAAAYQVKDKTKNRFRIVAYQRAADAIEHLSSEAKDLFDEGKLTDVSGIGESIAKHLEVIFNSGKSKDFEKILRTMPVGMFELLKVNGIGPKTAFKIASEFKLDKKNVLQSVKKIAQEGKIRQLQGFGEESEAEILIGIKEYENKPIERLSLPYASQIANEIIGYLKQNTAVIEADPLGSLRRKASSVGDIDISVATNNPENVIDYFCNFPNKSRIIEKGVKTASILLPNEIQVDVMVGPPAEYGSLLSHFTGSKHHNIALREFAQKKGLSLSEYGIRKIKVNSNKNKLLKFKSEPEFYKFLGLNYIEPELREDTGEIQASLENKLPELIQSVDIKADLQIHSNFDIETSHDLGESTMEELIDKANQLNYEYLAFTEHNPSKSKHNTNQVLEILKRKREKIDQLNYSLKMKINNRVKRVFNSLEIDILPDGNIPVKNDALKTLDFGLVSIHSSFKLSRVEMTKRVLCALENPKIKIFAHPTARKINHRESIELNWEEIFEFCLKNNKWIEINADPMRLDLPDFLVREAVKQEVKLTLGTDAHHKNHMDNMKWGISVARRGWATKNDIINTKSLADFEKGL